MAFIEWEVPTKRQGGPQMKENECSLYSFQNRKNPVTSITLNNKVSKELREKNLVYISIRQDDITGEIGFVFSEDRGLKMSTTGKEQDNLKLACKEWTERLLKVLKLEREKRYILTLSNNLSKIDDVIFMKIINYREK